MAGLDPAIWRYAGYSGSRSSRNFPSPVMAAEAAIHDNGQHPE
jgi:hypothetical protein